MSDVDGVEIEERDDCSNKINIYHGEIVKDRRTSLPQEIAVGKRFYKQKRGLRSSYIENQNLWNYRNCWRYLYWISTTIAQRMSGLDPVSVGDRDNGPWFVFCFYARGVVRTEHFSMTTNHLSLPDLFPRQ